MKEMIPTWVDGDLVAVEKLEAHQRGLLHKAISVFVICDGAVLIQRRAMGKYHTPGLWANTCCTHPHWGESALDCANRRLQEELGITGLTLKHRDQLTYRADVGGGLIEHERVDIFLCELAERIEVAPNPDEVMDTAWVDIRELTVLVQKAPENYTPWLRIYLTEHAARIFGEND